MATDRKSAIVTGASRGIGRGIAIALGREGFDVIINYASNAAAAEEVAAIVRSAGGRAVPIRADIASPADRQSLVDQTLAAFGRIDLLVNNAGVAPDVRADLLDLGEASFDRLIDINLKGPFFLTQIVARRMIEEWQKLEVRSEKREVPSSVVRGPLSVASRDDAPTTDNGQLTTDNSHNSQLATRNSPPIIINITSVSAYAPSINRGDYCIAKAGLAMMTQLYAARLAAHGITVYELRPGVIETDMTGPVKAKYDDLIFNKDLTPLRRWGTSEDVAKAVVAIAGGLLPFSTGEVINVDGGYHIRRL